MAIEGLKSTNIIPFIKKDRETDANQRRKQDRDRKNKRKKDNDPNKSSGGKVDIRI